MFKNMYPISLHIGLIDTALKCPLYSIPTAQPRRFEEKSEVMDQLDHQLRRLHSSTEALFEYRRALANSTGSLSRYKILGLVIYRVIHLP